MLARLLFITRRTRNYILVLTLAWSCLICVLFMMKYEIYDYKDLTYDQKSFDIDNDITIAVTSTNITHSTTRINTRTSDNNYLFHEEIHLDILALVNESTVINWSPDHFASFSNLFDYDVYERTNDTTMRIWTDQTRHIVFTRSGLCSVLKQFKDSGSVKKHIVIANLNENWGALSTPVLNRTVDWGDLESHWKKAGCNKTDVMTYLDHEHTLAVFTTQHQAFAHPKVYSIPLGTHGVENGMKIVAFTRKNTLNRTNLLMINSRASLTRKGQHDAVLKSFHDKGYMLNNTFMLNKNRRMNMDQYYDEMRKSKFIMCPSGMGWDTYRMWEAFYLGIIPVVEKYNRRDGWHKTMDGLPIVWVNTFEKDLNPAFLESEYKRIVAAKEQYKFEKLTIQYWKAFVESFLPDTNETSHLLTPHNISFQMKGPSLRPKRITTPKKKKKKTLLKKVATEKGNTNRNKQKSTEESSNLKEKLHKFLHQHPDRLKICDTQKLVFDDSKMIGRIDDGGKPLIFNHTSHLVYGPHITKMGSTSARGTLRNILNVTNKQHIRDPKNFEPYNEYVYYAFLRHPLQRFLAGFHQVEVFWRMNWLEGVIDKHGLQFWNKFCTLQERSTFEVLSKGHQCTGSEHSYDIVTRLGRLHAFMDDIDRVGFFDQHIMPISYQLKNSVLYTELKSEENRPVVFDIASMTNVHESLINIVQGRALTNAEKLQKMKRNKSSSMDPVMPWVVSWVELITIATSMHNQTDAADPAAIRNQEVELAKTAIEKMCRLFENDVKCLPYEIPECKQIADKGWVWGFFLN